MKRHQDAKPIAHTPQPSDGAAQGLRPLAVYQHGFIGAQHYVRERLYFSEDDGFFLVGEGGSQSVYALPLAAGYSVAGHRVRPIAHTSVLRWYAACYIEPSG